MAKKGTRQRVLDFIEGLPIWSRSPDADERTELHEERQRLKDVKSRLLEILNNDALISTGRVQIIGLETLKEKLGERWEGHSDFVHNSLRAILRRRLSPSDVFFRHEGDDYVIVFATLGLAAARLVCAGVIQELNTMLLGFEESDSIVVRTAVGVVDGRLLLEENTLDDVLKELSDVDREEVDIDWEEAIAGAGVDRPTTGLSNDKANAINWEPLVYAGGLRRQTYEPWTPIDEDALDEGVVPDEFSLIYRPMWSPAQEIISTFSTNFVGADENGQLRNAYSFVRGPKLTRSMDVHVLKRATATATSLFELRQRFVLAIPHHYESVTNWTRLYEYVEWCKNVPKDMYNYVILSCDDFPSGVPASKLQMIGYALRPYCRGLAVNVSWTTRDLAPYGDAGFTTVGLFVPPDTPFAAAQIRIEEFAAAGRRRGLQTAVLNVHDIAVAEVIRDAGIDFVMGRLIGDYQEKPTHMIRLPWSEILDRARAAS
jgi:hypothetical protein